MLHDFCHSGASRCKDSPVVLIKDRIPNAQLIMQTRSSSSARKIEKSATAKEKSSKPASKFSAKDQRSSPVEAPSKRPEGSNKKHRTSAKAKNRNGRKSNEIRQRHESSKPTEGPIPIIKRSSISAQAPSHDHLQLEARIRSAIEAAKDRDRNRRNGWQVSYNHFTIAITVPPTKPLQLIRDAASSGIATLICSDSTRETYSLPVPIAPPAFLASPEQWWVGLSREEMFAGPIRDDEDLEDAKLELVRQNTRRNNLVGLDGLAKAEKLAEGLKRQALGLPMSGRILKADLKRAREEPEEHSEVLGEVINEARVTRGAGRKVRFFEVDEMGSSNDEEATYASGFKRRRIQR